MTAIGWRKRGGSKPIKFTKEKTMTKNKALKLALEALGKIADVNAMDYEYRRWAKEAITAIKEALAQPEQEPERYTGGNGTAGREADVRPTAFFFTIESKLREKNGG